MTNPDLLRKAARRAAASGVFLASPLLRVADAEALDEAGLARRLGCDTAAIPSLLLCRRPSREAERFRADLVRIAQRFGVDAIRLAEAIRLGESLEALSGAAAEQRDVLAAARDREPDGGESDDCDD